MQRLRFLPWLILAGFTELSTGGESKPNFSGVWMLPAGEHREFMLIGQNETELRVIQFVEDRPVTVRGPIDGQSRPQAGNGYACDFLARWDGDALFFETKPGQPSANYCAASHYRMRLGPNGDTMTVERSMGTPTPAKSNENWEKQDLPISEHVLTGFELLRIRDDPSEDMRGVSGNLMNGWLGHAFNDVEQAERELLKIIRKPASEFKPDESYIATKARDLLVGIYQRNLLIKKARKYSIAEDRSFFVKLAKYPQISVSHRGYARLKMARDPGGRIMLPVTAGGKDASFLVDNGSNNSLLRMSEARRLGLKLEPLTRRMAGYNAKDLAPHLTIVPVLIVGATRLDHVPFWVLPDDQLEWSGVLGIDVLLKLETLRWNTAGVVEVGFPAMEKDIRKANLCFNEDIVLVAVSSSRLGDFEMVLDTGSNQSAFFPPFAAHFPDPISADTELTVFEVSDHGKHHELHAVKVPEIQLRVGNMETVLRQVPVVLERVLFSTHGTIGMDVLNRAKQVTLDFKAMRLSLE